MRIASPASKSPSKPVQALTGTLFGVKLWQSLSAVSVARHCFFWATPNQKLHPYVTQILSSFLRIVKCIFAKSPAVVIMHGYFPPAHCRQILPVLSIIEPQDLSSAASFSIYNSENFLSIKIRCRCRTHFRHLHALHQDLIDFFAIQFTRICLYDIAGISNFPEYLRCDLHI